MTSRTNKTSFHFRQTLTVCTTLELLLGPNFKGDLRGEKHLTGDLDRIRGGHAPAAKS